MRDFDSGLQTALESGRYGVRVLLRVDMPDGVVGFCDDVQAIISGSVTHHAKPGMFTVRLPGTVVDGTVQGLEVIVSGLDAEVAADVESEPWHQRPAEIDLVIFAADDPTSHYVVPWFSGFLDQIRKQERADGEARLVCRLEDYNRDLDRSAPGVRGDADQRLRNADDTFFGFVAKAKNTQMIWGASSQKVAPQSQPRGDLGFLGGGSAIGGGGSTTGGGVGGMFGG
jgi:hypothetical protein